MTERKLAIIVPTLGRPDRLERVVANIHDATATPHCVYLVVEGDDQESIDAMQGLDAAPICGEFGCHVAAANAGVDATTEPFFLVGGDDVIFHPEWDISAFEAMTGDVRTVGIDQGNGRMECFILVDRRYVSEHGFYYDGYRSQFADTDFMERAKDRGVWADAEGALIEHLHWTFGKSAVDDTYQRGIDSTAADQAVYAQRRVVQWHPV